MLYSRTNDVAAGTLPKYMNPGVNPGGPNASPTVPPVGTASAPGPTPTPPPAPGTVQTAPGYTPDYASLIQNDPGYQSANAAAQLAQRQAAAQRKQQLQQAIIQYGGLPTGFADQYGDIDQSVLDQAGQNQFSTLANLAKGYDQSSEQFKRGLAARGVLQSGDLNYGEDQLNTAYGQQRYDAANALGGNVNNVLSQYMGVLQGNAQSMSGAVQGAESNVYSNPAYRPTDAQSANYDAANTQAYGQPIYVDSSGNMYDMNGNPFSPPSASPSGTPGGSPYDPYVGNARTPGLQM